MITGSAGNQADSPLAFHIMMNQYVKQKWITALRSGEYMQTRGRLRYGDSYCCLGVLTDLYDKEIRSKSGWSEKDVLGSHCYIAYGTVTEAYLPQCVMQWAGLKEENPYVGDYRLAFLNDYEELDFKQQADIIEEKL
jgi:hypothetical protein